MSEADGYQPHLIAPEQGYRRLIEGALNYFRGPAEASVDAVSCLFNYFKWSKFFSCAVTFSRCIFLYVGSLRLERTCEEIYRRNSGKKFEKISLI